MESNFDDDHFFTISEDIRDATSATVLDFWVASIKNKCQHSLDDLSINVLSLARVESA